MQLLELKYLIEVAEAGSFTRAATKLGMTQPALSRQILKLEQELHTRLLYRHGRGVVLTENGLKLRNLVKPLMAQLAEMKEEILERGDKLSGRVTMGVTPHIGNTVTAPLVQRVLKTLPDVTLRVHEAFSATLKEETESGRLDLAIFYDDRRSQNLIVTPLLQEDFYLIQPGRKSFTKPLPIEELPNVRLLLMRKENGFRRVIDAAAHRENIELNVAMEIDSISAIKQLILAGEGFTLLPFGAVYREVREGELNARPIKSSAMYGMLVAATPLNRPISKTVKELLQLVRAEVQRCVAAGILKGRTSNISLRGVSKKKS